MRIRAAWLAAVAALAATGLVHAPASAAEPTNPVISGLSLATAGHATGTISSTAEVVYLQFGGIGAGTRYQEPDFAVAMTAGHGSFDLETWGRKAGSTIVAIGCSGTGLDQVCSGETETTPFTPTESRPTITWSSDTEVGLGENITIQSSDPQGGGELWLAWNYSDEYSSNNLYVSIDRNGTTVLTEDQLIDTSGTASIVRCNTNYLPRCTSFSPAISKVYSVEQKLRVTAGRVDPLTLAHPSRPLTLTSSRAGAYEALYDLADRDTGVLVPGTHTTASGSVSQADGPFAVPVDAGTVADGIYKVVGTVKLTVVGKGTFQKAFESEAFLISRSRPPVSAVSLSNPVVYPLIRTTQHPGIVRAKFARTVVPDQQLRAEVRDSTGKVVASSSVPWSQGPANAIYEWDGRVGPGINAPAGRYTMLLLDQWDNESLVSASIQVSGQRLITKILKKTVTPAASLDAKFVGKCSTLRRPSLRGWAGSLGFYATPGARPRPGTPAAYRPCTTPGFRQQPS